PPDAQSLLAHPIERLPLAVPPDRPPVPVADLDLSTGRRKEDPGRGRVPERGQRPPAARPHLRFSLLAWHAALPVAAESICPSARRGGTGSGGSPTLDHQSRRLAAPGPEGVRGARSP